VPSACLLCSWSSVRAFAMYSPRHPPRPLRHRRPAPALPRVRSLVVQLVGP
jgi:hypothetical protein